MPLRAYKADLIQRKFGQWTGRYESFDKACAISDRLSCLDSYQSVSTCRKSLFCQQGLRPVFCSGCFNTDKASTCTNHPAPKPLFYPPLSRSLFGIPALNKAHLRSTREGGGGRVEKPTCLRLSDLPKVLPKVSCEMGPSISTYPDQMQPASGHKQIHEADLKPLLERNRPLGCVLGSFNWQGRLLI